MTGTSSGGSDRRRHERCSDLLPLGVEHEGRRFGVIARNVSPTGILFGCYQRLLPGNLIVVTWRSPAESTASMLGDGDCTFKAPAPTREVEMRLVHHRRHARVVRAEAQADLRTAGFPYLIAATFAEPLRRLPRDERLIVTPSRGRTRDDDTALMTVPAR